MMDVYGWMAILSFLGVVGVSLYRIWNLLHVCTKYDLRTGFILFVGFLIAFALSWGVFMLEPLVPLYGLMFSFARLFLALNGLLLFVEVIFYLVREVLPQNQGAYMPKR